MKRAIVRVSQNGWVVVLDNQLDNFYPFKSTEGFKLVKFLAEKVVGVSLDEIIRLRQEEAAENSKRAFGA